MPKNIFDLWDEEWEPKVGDCFTLWNYNDPIEWVVLKVENGKMLVVSKYIIEWMPFDESGKRDWNSSSLRKWLNNDFPQKSVEFIEEDESFEDSTMINFRNENGDFVFLIDYQTAEESYDLFCEIGSFPTSQLVEENEHEFGDWYEEGQLANWLMPEDSQFAYIDPYGDACNLTDEDASNPVDNYWYGKNNFSKPLGVRPAMWLTTDPDMYG